MHWFLHGFYEAAIMLWQTFGALVFGYVVSASLQVFVRKEQMIEHFGRANSGWKWV